VADDFPQQFDFPFHIDPLTGDFATVDQDSDDDVANCVQIVCMTPQGSRDEDPTFGLPEFALSRAPLDASVLLASISASEPRAALLVEANQAAYDEALWSAGVQAGVR
jgi:phage baseplate assembly protein W